VAGCQSGVAEGDSRAQGEDHLHAFGRASDSHQQERDPEGVRAGALRRDCHRGEEP
jgi:hypothetical protein